MGRKLMERVVNIVKPATILAWQRRLEKQKWDYSKRRRRQPGRPKTPGNIETLVCQLARENTWGYKKIQGELQKLGIAIAKTTVANILRRNRLSPSPERGGLT
jgi:putative transposase